MKLHFNHLTKEKDLYNKLTREEKKAAAAIAKKDTHLDEWLDVMCGLRAGLELFVRTLLEKGNIAKEEIPDLAKKRNDAAQGNGLYASILALEEKGLLPKEYARLAHTIRKKTNLAVHYYEGIEGGEQLKNMTTEEWRRQVEDLFNEMEDLTIFYVKSFPGLVSGKRERKTVTVAGKHDPILLAFAILMGLAFVGLLFSLLF